MTISDSTAKYPSREQQISAPLIGLVPIPSLLVERIDVNFYMEVKDTKVENNTFSASCLQPVPNTSKGRGDGQ
ncbi:MAG: DUF2589 domain-containing protein [Muribaculaceae bacterium]|nr:DUF2589 domain-containing protein [Muribaculaceae bacterium]